MRINQNNRKWPVILLGVLGLCIYLLIVAAVVKVAWMVIVA